jgi:competence protein ComEA
LHADRIERVDDILIEPTWRARLRSLQARRRESWTIVGILIALVAVALLVWGRPPAARIAPPATAPSRTAAGPAPNAIYVHVAGAVREPGLYRFPEGARVADAVETAGGPLRGADLDAINLAQLLVDGSKIDVPRAGDSAPSVGGTAPPSPGLVSLNSADQAGLETVPGIGPVTALAIISERERLGGFDAIEQLLEVDGIGPSTLESIRPYLSL